MTVTAYAQSADVVFVWGQYGADLRLDDNEDGAQETGYMANALEIATTEINSLLFGRYSVATLAASPWVKWACAYLAAEIIGRRRGSGVPASLQEQTGSYRETMRQIKAGNEYLPADTGMAAPSSDHSPSHSNMEIDSRYHRRKVRTIRDTSTGDPPGDGAKRNETFDFPGYWP